jgi:hypothetical protein
MKFIAPKEFNQGLGNPLGIAGGDPHIKIGTIFSIGDDFTSVDQLEGEDLKLYQKFFAAGCLCPVDSDRGRHLLAEVAMLKELEEKATEEERLHDPGNKWWKKPAGITTLTLIGLLIAVGLVVILVHYFSS